MRGVILRATAKIEREEPRKSSVISEVGVGKEEEARRIKKQRRQPGEAGPTTKTTMNTKTTNWQMIKLRCGYEGYEGGEGDGQLEGSYS